MKRGFVRIIAGIWRGRLIKIPKVADLRPTPDRVRETLFNWLSPVIRDATCLDLFAGSGILGFEALSRGAQYVEWMDQSKVAVATIKEEMKQLKIENGKVYCREIPKHLKHQEPQKFNIIFIDPPYRSSLLFPTCKYLEEQGFLDNPAYIYLEAKTLINDNELPNGWKTIRHSKAGQVHYHLVRREVS